jgi:GNAT superfamily N-acetyltransferase
MVSTRPPVERVTPAYRAQLLALAFHDLGERVEFKTPVAELPTEGDSPLAWQTLDEFGLELAARTLSRASIGDPHGLAPDEDPRAVIEGYAQELDLASGPRAVAVGFLEGRPAAFVCAQVHGQTGWSRIAYMGLDPEFRGRHLGAWIHRHGFTMIREQHGTLYHGGTSALNRPMLALFQGAGCKLHARLSEWEWRA